MEKIIDNMTFRIKKLNALELLAMQSQISYESYKESKAMYSMMLENIEVKVGDKWLQVKETDQDIFYPVELESNVSLMKQLISMFMQYFSSVFPKSND